MVVCCIIGCRNRSRKRKINVSFHRIPKTEDRKSKWMKALEGVSRKTGWVCSDHFTEESFDRTQNRTMLRSEATPSVFTCCPDVLIAKNKKPDIQCCAQTSVNSAISGTKYLKLFEDIPDANMIKNELGVRVQFLEQETFPEIIIKTKIRIIDDEEM